MKFLSLILNNIWRNPQRTLLTIFGLAIALLVFCALLSINQGMNTLAEHSASKAHIVVTDKNISSPVFTGVPQRYASSIKSIPHVVGVTPEQLLIIPYRTENEQITCVGIDPSEYRNFRYFKVIEGSYERFGAEKKAALVGVKITRKYNWKVGQNIISKDNLFLFTIQGIISEPNSEIENMVYVHFDYIQEVMDRQGIVTLLLVKVEDPQFVDQVIAEIDTNFANYPVATKSQAETQIWNTLLKDLNPMVGMFSMIGYIAIFAALLGTINTISISVRERRGEIGTLKTLGFSRSKILGIITAESLIISVAGGVLGCLLAYLISLTGKFTVQVGPQTPSIIVTLPIIMKGLIVSIFVGLISGFFPAFQATKLKVIDALKGID